MTAQVHEKIRYQGKCMGLASCPEFPEDPPRISEVSEEEIILTVEQGLVIKTEVVTPTRRLIRIDINGCGKINKKISQMVSQTKL